MAGLGFGEREADSVRQFCGNSGICRIPDDILGVLVQFWGTFARIDAGAARWGGARAGASPAVPL